LRRPLLEFSHSRRQIVQDPLLRLLDGKDLCIAPVELFGPTRKS
jgi:hypothetical protein